MKRVGATVLFLGALAGLGGCPIYSHEDDGCYRDSDCAPGYLCDDNSGECLAPSNQNGGSCRAPRDCSPSYTCSENGLCVAGDCYFSGCVSGFQCQSSTGTWECMPTSMGAAGAGGSEAGNGGAAGTDTNAAGSGG